MSIRCSQLTKSFGTPPTPVIRGIDLEIQRGEFVSIIGKSGCGKSTLLYLLSTLDEPSGGQIWIDDVPLSQLDQKKIHQFRNKKMGFVFQFHHLLPELTALENVLMPAVKCKEHRQREALALSLFEEFEIEHRLHHFPGQLSGGEQQRIAIARALIMEPDYLFADEPTGNLDSINGKIVMDLLQRINQEKKMAVIYVTHDAEFAARASRTLSMADGKLVGSAVKPT